MGLVERLHATVMVHMQFVIGAFASSLAGSCKNDAYGKLSKFPVKSSRIKEIWEENTRTADAHMNEWCVWSERSAGMPNRNLNSRLNRMGTCAFSPRPPAKPKGIRCSCRHFVQSFSIWKTPTALRWAFKHSPSNTFILKNLRSLLM